MTVNKHQGNPAKQGDTNSTQPTADALKEVSIPYKFEVGGFYLIEVKEWAIPRGTLRNLDSYFYEKGIHVAFVPTRGEGFALQAVPAVIATTQVSDLLVTDDKALEGYSEAQIKDMIKTLDNWLIKGKYTEAEDE